MILDRSYIAYTRSIITTQITSVRFRQGSGDGNAHYQHPPKRSGKPKRQEDRQYHLQYVRIQLDLCRYRKHSQLSDIILHVRFSSVNQATYP